MLYTAEISTLAHAVNRCQLWVYFSAYSVAISLSHVASPAVKYFVPMCLQQNTRSQSVLLEASFALATQALSTWVPCASPAVFTELIQQQTTSPCLQK